MYGWKRNYILWKLTLPQIFNYYKYGLRFDYERRGWKFKDDVDAPSWKEVRESVYSPAELKEIEEYKKKHFGKDVEGL